MTDQIEILVMARKESKWLEKRAGDPGIKYTICTNLNSAVKRLRSGKYRTIAVDYQHASTDVLEFLLNARDVAPEARVFVVDKNPVSAQEQLARTVPWVFFADTEELKHKLAPTLLDKNKAVQTSKLRCRGERLYK